MIHDITSAATVLTIGKVLVTGGYDIDLVAIKNSKLYDLSTGKWTFTGSLRYPRAEHATKLLPNGKVLVTGGATDNGYDLLKTCELYDLSSVNWTLTGSMHDQRFSHTAKLLLDGKVLLSV